MAKENKVAVIAGNKSGGVVEFDRSKTLLALAATHQAVGQMIGLQGSDLFDEMATDGVAALEKFKGNKSAFVLPETVRNTDKTHQALIKFMRSLERVAEIAKMRGIVDTTAEKAPEELPEPVKVAIPA
jgi:hypothetical protein